MELKYYYVPLYGDGNGGSNRTFMELKLRRNKNNLSHN